MSESTNTDVAITSRASEHIEKRREWLGSLFVGVVVLTVMGIGAVRLFGIPQLPIPRFAENPNEGLPAASVSSMSSAVLIRATATIDTEKQRQHLEGFGAATAFYQNWITSHPHKKELYNALFKELDLDILRLQNVYRPEKGADFAKDDLDIVRGAKESLGRSIPLMISSWSPPAALKSNGAEKNGGTLAKVGNDYNYAGFAAYWRDSLIAYRKIGISPTYITIQNEPDWKAEWETCLFRPTEDAEYAGWDKAFDAVYNSLKSLPESPKILGPETLGIGYDNPEKFLPPTDKARIGRIYGIAHHLYHGGTHEEPDSFIPRMQAIRNAYPNKPRFQTEFGRSDGFQTAWMIHNSLVEEEAAAYVYWAAIWPDEDCLITIDNPWNRGEWKHPQGFKLNDRYYALMHYSRFIRPGYRRVDASTGERALKVSAYISPDRSRLVAVVLNTSTKESAELTIDIKGFTKGEEITLYRTCEATSEKFLRQDSPTAGSPLSLPPRSIVTMVVEGGNRR